VETFFTSDTHFGHRNIITLCSRPFLSVEEMDETIIENWNRTIGKNDVVWHLGDFTLLGEGEAIAYRKRLNGKINFIWGNHDRNAVRNLHMWESSQFAREIKVGDSTITLCHYGMRVWNKSHHGALMLYGHSHGRLPGNNQSLDVGVDSWNFTPVNLHQILERMAELPSYRQEDNRQTES
jgi:calcineurin-like phosphoesterase family protein